MSHQGPDLAHDEELVHVLLLERRVDPRVKQRLERDLCAGQSDEEREEARKRGEERKRGREEVEE
jgi:hypothetical protein